VQRAWLPYKDKGIVTAEKNIELNIEKNKQTGFMPSNPM